MSRGAASPEAVRAALLRLFVGAEGAGLRAEDEKKCAEVVALLAELDRLGRGGPLVDAAAGKAPVGLLAAELLGFSRLVVIERDPARAAACRAAAARLDRPVALEVREADVGDPAAWPERPDIAAALHACGAAADAIIDAAIRVRARHLLLVPCCYGADVPLAATAAAAAARERCPRQAALRKRQEAAWIDAERTFRLEAGGFAVEVVPFVAPTVTPHNLLWRCRWAGEPVAMARAARARAALLGLLATR